MKFSRLLLFSLFLAARAQADSPLRVPVNFSFTSDVGLGNSVFLVGNHADLGAWDVTHAVKLRYTSGNVWTGEVAIQAGTQLQYSFISRSTTPTSWCDSTNATYLSGVQTMSIAAQPASPFHGKTIYYLSGWTTPNLFYLNGSNGTTAAMTKIGAGRTTGESLFKITGVGNPGENLEFVFTDGAGHYDNPPGGGNYLTSDDVFYVEDGNVFSYQPPPSFSAPQIITHYVDSTAPNIPARYVHIFLPRGYNENTTKRYPVVYFHDGQNVFDPGGPYGSWSADATATREMGQGRVREAIFVAIDNDANRIPEYQPPMDSYQGVQGIADAYASFAINNVRPYIDNAYRTLNDAPNTLTIGSSLGGLVSLYFGREFSTFGKIGVMSPAFWISPNYVAQVTREAKKPLRVYLDFGTSEPTDDWDNCLSMYDVHLAQTYATNDDLWFVGGCGQSHNEAAWSARLPAALQYLLPAREEPQLLAQRDYPPAFGLTSLNRAASLAVFNYESLFGFAYRLQRSTNLTSWSDVTTSSVETLPWTTRSISDNALASTAKCYWRLIPQTP